MPTTISWTDETMNPLVGCSKISEGCKNCYAASASATPRLQQFKQYQGITDDRGNWTGEVRFVPEVLQKILKIRKPKKIFMPSMSDMFHKNVKDEWLDQIFAVMALSPHLTFQVLTKRPERMLEYLTTPHRHGKILMASRSEDTVFPNGMFPLAPNWPLPNVWLGVSVENQKAADMRIPLLIKTPAAVRFLSVEPLLEAIDFTDASIWFIESEMAKDGWDDQLYGMWEDFDVLSRIDQVIVGGESGKGYRDCNPEWITAIARQCQDAGVAVWVKQDSAYQSGKQGRIPDGVWNLKQFPEVKS